MAFLEEYPEGWQGKYMLTTDWWLPTASQNTKYSGLLEVPYTYCLPTLKFLLNTNTIFLYRYCIGKKNGIKGFVLVDYLTMQIVVLYFCNQTFKEWQRKIYRVMQFLIILRMII